MKLISDDLAYIKVYNNKIKLIRNLQIYKNSCFFLPFSLSFFPPRASATPRPEPVPVQKVCFLSSITRLPSDSPF